MDVLKGNFTPRNQVTVEASPEESAEAKFEREVLKRLGGSVSFVRKRKVQWDAPSADQEQGE